MCDVHMFNSTAGVPEADAASARWTDDYLESKMNVCPRCNVMRSGGFVHDAARASIECPGVSQAAPRAVEG